MYVRGYLQGSENGRVVTIAWRIGYPQSAGSFITCIEHRYAVVLLGFSGHDATFSLMWSRDLCD